MRTYAVSDPHGRLEPLVAAFELADLPSDSSARMLVLGDMIDRGPQSAQVLAYVQEQQRLLGDGPDGQPRVEALLGNHEVDFLAWLDADDWDWTWLLADRDLETVRSFLTEEQLDEALGSPTGAARSRLDGQQLNGRLKRALLEHQGGLVAWLRARPLVLDLPHAVYVHAGVDELSGAFWRASTPDHVLTHKWPVTTGPFVKTIVAGHAGSSLFREPGSRDHSPFFDGESHWYIDATVERSGQLGLLIHDDQAPEPDRWRSLLVG